MTSLLTLLLCLCNEILYRYFGIDLTAKYILFENTNAPVMATF